MSAAAVHRFPALLGAGLALVAGVWGGLALLGLGVPLPCATSPAVGTPQARAARPAPPKEPS